MTKEPRKTETNDSGEQETHQLRPFSVRYRNVEAYQPVDAATAELASLCPPSLASSICMVSQGKTSLRLHIPSHTQSHYSHSHPGPLLPLLLTATEQRRWWPWEMKVHFTLGGKHGGICCLLFNTSPCPREAKLDCCSRREIREKFVFLSQDEEKENDDSFFFLFFLSFFYSPDLTVFKVVLDSFSRAELCPMWCQKTQCDFIRNESGCGFLYSLKYCKYYWHVKHDIILQPQLSTPKLLSKYWNF